MAKMSEMQAPAQVTRAGQFMKSAGRFAGERFAAAIQAGRPISPKELRTNGVLRDREWKAFDNELVLGFQEKIAGVADLIAAGNVLRITNGLSKTVLEYDKIGDMDDAIVSMDGIDRSENDGLEFERAGLPLPIIHKDFWLGLRHLESSRNDDTPLDTTYSRISGRKCGEMAEYMLFNGGKQFQGLKIYGYTTALNRNTGSFGTNGNWAQTAKTGDNILTDIFTMIAALENDGFDGPYWMYVGGTAANLKLGEDFKAASDKTIRDRILELGRISKIGRSDKLADNVVLLIQPTTDVVKMVEGEPLQTVQWDIEGGFQINFKAFQILIPLIRDDIEGNSGIFHMS